MSDQEALRQWSLCILELELLSSSKHHAVAAEDYDRAHIIKQLQSEISTRLLAAKREFLENSNDSPLVARIQVLHKKKRTAVEKEDFDLAHEIKEQLLELERYTDTEALGAALKLLEDIGSDVLLLTCDPAVTEILSDDDPDIWTEAAKRLREGLKNHVAPMPDLIIDQLDAPSLSWKKFAALPASQLKAELQLRGVEHAHCVEKMELLSLLTTSLSADTSHSEGQDKTQKHSCSQQDSCDKVEGPSVEEPVRVALDSESSDKSSSDRGAMERLSSKKQKERGKKFDKKHDKKRKKKEKKRKKKQKKQLQREKKRMDKLKQAKKEKKDKKGKKHRKDKLKTNRKRSHVCISSSSVSESSSTTSSLKLEEIAVEFSKAAAQGDTMRAQHLVLYHGNKFRSACGDGPLHIAARFNQPVLVDFLLRQPGSCRLLEARNHVGDTALLVASRLFRGRIALGLVEALADPGAINKNGESPESFDLDGLVREAEQDEKFRQSAAGERLLTAVSAARKIREDLEWRTRFFEEVADLDFTRFDGYHDLESVDTGSNDWMGEVGRQAAARASAERLAQQAMAAAAAAKARERDRISKAQAKTERATASTARSRPKNSEEPTGATSEPITQAEDEETRLAARAADEARWQAFQLVAVDDSGLGNAKPSLREADVPFPSGPPENPLRLDPNGHPAVRRSQLRAGLLRWHPDKFEQRFGRFLSADSSEQEAVLGRVKAIAQQLNQLMAELLPDSASRND